MTTTSPSGGDEDAGRAEEVPGQDADHGRRDQLAHQDEQQQRVEEVLGRLGEAHQGRAPRRPWSRSERGPRLVHAHQRGLGHGEEPRERRAARPPRCRGTVSPEDQATRDHGAPRGSGARAARARAPPCARPRRRPRGPSPSRCSTPCTTSSATSSSKEHSCSVALRAATAGQITTSPMSWGISGGRRLARAGAPGVGHAAGRLGLGVDGEAQHVGGAARGP